MGYASRSEPGQYRNATSISAVTGRVRLNELYRKIKERIWCWGGRQLFWNQTESLRAEVRNLVYELTDELLAGTNRAKLPQIKSKQETLQELVTSTRSIARFGDGEFRLLLGEGITYQEHNKILEARLRIVLASDEPDILIGIPSLFGSLGELKPSHRRFWRAFFYRYREDIYKVLRFDKTYYDTQVTRPHIIYESPKMLNDFFEQFRGIWRGKHVIVVEGTHTRLGVGNDLLDEAASVQRIIGPARHAFRCFDALLEEAARFGKDYLYLLALGPTATILAFELGLRGCRALDIGHIDLEYEWFRRNCSHKTAIPGKCLAEGGFTNRLEFDDQSPSGQKYRAQVAVTIEDARRKGT